MSDLFAPPLIPLEMQTTFTLLGIRFWDHAGNAPVSHDLQVTAWPTGRPQRKATAFRTGNGIYAFQGLPGLRHLEQPTGQRTPWDDDVTPTRFIFEVTDRRRRFLTLAYAVDVPFRGIFPTDAATSPVADTPGVLLFSAATRTPTPALGLVRAQLMIADPSRPEPVQPAAYAMMELSIAGEDWVGIAGADGQVALFFPYPDFTSPLVFSSPVEAMEPQTWPFSVRIQYQESAQNIPYGASAPDINTLFNQAPADIWLNETGDTTGELAELFTYGEEPVLHTGLSPTLWLTPG